MTVYEVCRIAFADPPLRQIFRYDNAHIYTHEGHPDAFHKHVFNDRNWKEIGVEHVGREKSQPFSTSSTSSTTGGSSIAMSR